MDNAILLRGVSKVFDGAPPVVAVEDISMDVHEQEFLAIVGPSGCGKSTLLRLVAGLIEPTAGNAIVHGKSPAQAQADVEFGFVFQDPVLFPWLPTIDNVLLPDKILGKRNPRAGPDQAAYARQLLAQVGLAGFERHFPEQLSGGMKQRVALARALSYHPSILLMDEPFGALDEFTRDRLNLQLLEVWDKIRATVLFVTHSIAEAVFLADRVVAMTPRPGKVARQVRVPFPRPRRFEMRYDPAFVALVAELRSLLEPEENTNDTIR